MARMSEISRRDLLKLGVGTGAMAFVGRSLLFHVAGAQEGEAATALPQVPRRILGKTGQSIPILLQGGSMPLDMRFDPKLAEVVRFGVNYFDAGANYAGGNCESAIGNFIETSDLSRDQVWVTSKSHIHDPLGLEQTLDEGLIRLKSGYFDMYFLHGLKDPLYLSAEMKNLVERLQKEGKIRHFGFSCHDGNVVELLNKAADTEWIDAVMFRYNFDQYGNKELNDAMDRCVKAGVGLIAMKTQRSEVSFQKEWQKFDVGKWTKQQAVLKAVWADERISAAVSHMDTFDKLKQNIAAALDDVELGQAEWEQLKRYGVATRSAACDGCDHICGAAVDGPVQIGATFRYLMYHDVYGEQAKARELFHKLPAEAQRLSGIDYAAAAALCPRGVDIARHMQRAAEVFQD
jgi:predicted aldo/keto reductase-like oxidoreductase